HIEEMLACVIERALRYLYGIVVDRAGEELYPYIGSQGLQLVDGCRTINVAADHKHLLILALLEPARQFSNAGGLARALQPRHHGNHRRAGAEIERIIRFAHDAHQLAMNDLDERLPGAEALGDLLAQRALLDVLDELAHHR